MIRLLALVAGIAAVAAMLWPDPPPPQAPGSASHPVTAATPAPAVPAPPPDSDPADLTREEINGQDQVTRAHTRRVQRDLDARPLLQQLPVIQGPTTIDVAGLAPDGRTVLEITGAPTLAQARRAYRAALRRAGDTGRAYLPRFLR